MRNTLPDVLRAALDSRVAELHTCLPGRVETYDASQQRASVRPLLNRRLRNGDIEELPVIPNVPVVFPRSGGASLTFPVRRGDGCMLMFSERSLDRWLSRGGVVTPDDPRKMALSDAICVPGLQPFTATGQPDNDNVRLRCGGAQLVINSDDRFEIGNSQAQLLDLIDQLLTALIATRTATAIGLQPLTESPTFAQIQASLAQIKGTL